MTSFSKNDLRTIIREEVANHVGQIKDQIYVAFLTQLKDEIRKDQMTDEEDSLAKLINETYVEPSQTQEVTIDACGNEVEVENSTTPKDDDDNIIIKMKDILE